MKTQARLVSVQLQFEIMADDGEMLKHVKTNPLIITPDQIASIPQVVENVMAQVQQQLDTQATQTTAPGD